MCSKTIPFKSYLNIRYLRWKRKTEIFRDLGELQLKVSTNMFKKKWIEKFFIIKHKQLSNQSQKLMIIQTKKLFERVSPSTKVFDKLSESNVYENGLDDWKPFNWNVFT